MSVERYYWWQMENQEVWPLGKPKNGKYYGRCAHPDADCGPHTPCFWPPHLAEKARNGKSKFCDKWYDIKKCNL